jgi:hypothetical protein
MRRLASLLLAIVSAACSAGGGGAYDGGRDAVYEVSLDLPPGCPPATANEKGVGAACTKGGGQCKNGLRCTCDPFFGVQLEGVPCICTLATFATVGSVEPCVDSVPANYCGANATCCSYLTTAVYCLPSICVPDGVCPEVVSQ